MDNLTLTCFNDQVWQKGVDSFESDDGLLENPYAASYFASYKNPTPNSIYITPATPVEIAKTVESLKLKTTSDTNFAAPKAASSIPGINEIHTNKHHETSRLNRAYSLAAQDSESGSNT